MKAAVIGLGVGRSHAEAYADLPETELVAVGYNDVWTVPGEEELPKRSLADHVARGEYVYRSGRYVNTEPDPADDQTWPTDYRFAEPARPNYHARQIADLVEAIRAGRRPLVDGVEGRKSVAILLAIYESARTGQPVRLSQPTAV